MKSAAHAEVYKRLKSQRREIPKGVSENYTGGGVSHLKFLGLKIPTHMRVYKEGFSFSSYLDTEQAKIWNTIWFESNCFDVANLALIFFDFQRRKGHALKWWPLLRNWAPKLDNWAHSDTLSKIYADALEQNFGEVYPTLKKWNLSKNSWLRRQSLVSLICYAQLREKYPPLAKVFPLVKNLLEDTDPYVQKGLGWTLRETWNIDPSATMKFLEKHLYSLSAIAFSYATEKIPLAQKRPLKEARRRWRLSR